MKSTVLALVAIAAVSASVFLGLARPWASEEAQRTAVVPTGRPSATATAHPTTVPPTATPLPDRTNCAEMRDTPYRSPTERTWFLSNCIAPTPVPRPQEIAEPAAAQLPPQPPPPQVPSNAVDPAQQAIVDQFVACSDTWWEGANVELALTLARLLGVDTSDLERQEQALRQTLESNCVGIGGRLAALPGANQLCSDLLGHASTLSITIQTAELQGASTYFLRFGKREVDVFIAAASC